VHITGVSSRYYSLTARYDSFLLVTRLAKCIGRVTDLLSFFRILRFPFVSSLALPLGFRRSFYELLCVSDFTRTAFNEHVDDCICYPHVILGYSTFGHGGTMFDGQRALRLWLELLALSQLLFVTL
jgi:hypothetical protein